MICQICGKEYSKIGYHVNKGHNINSKQYYDLYIKSENEGNCLYCSKSTIFRGINKGGYAKFCSNNCANKYNAPKISEKALNRTNEENKIIAKKARQTRLEHFGDETYGLFGSKRHQKAIQDKYGVNYVTQSPIIQEKSKQTCLQKYGCEYSFQSENNKLKTKQTNLKRYGVENVFQLRKISRNAHTIDAEKQRKISNCITRTMRIHKFEQEHNCIHKVQLIKKYGQGWLSLKLPQLYDSSSYAYIDNKYLPQIEDYANTNHSTYISQKEKELLQYITSIYDDVILENTKNIIHPYEIDIYLPKLKIAFEFNGMYWHSNLRVDEMYHFTKSKLCKDKDIRLIHIYEWEWDNQQDEIKNFIKNVINNQFEIAITDIVYCDFNKSNGTEYEKLGYTLVGYKSPNIWYWNDNHKTIVSETPIENYYAKICGSGYLIYKKGGQSNE